VARAALERSGLAPVISRRSMRVGITQRSSLMNYGVAIKIILLSFF